MAAAFSASAVQEGLVGLSQPERVELLRRRMAAIPGRTYEASPTALVAPLPEVEQEWPVAPAGVGALSVLPTPQAVSDLLPRGGLVRGAVVGVTGGRSVLLSILASVTAAGAHAAIVGQPKLGLLAAVEMGCDLRKVAWIRDPGAEPVDVASILVDGVDLVLLGLGGGAVTPSRARAVTARARTKGAVLVVSDGQWPGADVHIGTRLVGVAGLGLGRGRVTGIEVEVEVSGRGFQPRSRRLELKTSSAGGLVGDGRARRRRCLGSRRRQCERLWTCSGSGFG